jgi:hypothetical protein
LKSTSTDELAVNVMSGDRLFAHLATFKTCPIPNQMWGNVIAALMDWDVNNLPPWAADIPIPARTYGEGFFFDGITVQKSTHARRG